MTTAQKALIGVGIGAVILGIVLISRHDEPQIEATSAPPDFCTEKSFYIRACESSPYSQRWSGDAGTCNQTAICGAHTANCVGDDGFTYPIIDQGASGNSPGRYPKPADSAGAFVIASWEDCYINHNPNGPGNRQGCLTAVPPGGRLTYNALTWAQLPPGGQKDAWGSKYGCGGAGPTPTVVPTVTRTPVPVANPLAPWIEQLYRESITGGCATNPLVYCPTAPLTREAAAVMLLKVKHGSNYVPPKCTGIFADVPCAP